MKSYKKFIIASLLTVVLSSCSQQKNIKDYPISDLNEVIENGIFKLDSKITYDGTGSISVSIDKPQTIKVFEIENLEIEDSIVSYSAYIKTKDFKGKVYLEMLCSFEGRGEFFARSLDQTLSGNQDWTQLETQFFLKEGENPEEIKLNIVAEGVGKLWLDQVSLKSKKDLTLIKIILGAIIGILGATFGLYFGAKSNKKPNKQVTE